MRSRPEIDVRLPTSVLPGETFEIALTVTSRSVTPIDFIAVDFYVTNGRRSPDQSTASDQHELFHSTITVARKGQLQEKSHRYLAVFEVPATRSTTAVGPAIESCAWVEVHVAIPWWPDVRERHDVTIAPAPVARPATEAVPGSSLRGDEPFALWQEAGEAVGLALEPEKLRLTGEISGCRVRVSSGENAAKRSFLVAHLGWRTWGLGLSIAGVGLPVRVTHFPVETFQRRFQLGGRDPEQARHALRLPLRAALLVFHEVTFGDDEAEVRSDAPGHDQPRIGAFLADVAELARAIAEVSRQIPPPPAMAACVPAWRRFAADLEAELTVGNMAITGGEFEGSAVAIRTDFDGSAPTATTIELVIDPPIDAVPDFSSPGSLQRLPAPAREILISIGTLCRPWQGVDLERSPTHQVRESLISLCLPVLIADPAVLRDLMTALLALAAALRRDRHVGPYR